MSPDTLPVLLVLFQVAGEVNFPDSFPRHVFVGRFRIWDIGQVLFELRSDSDEEAIEAVIELSIGFRYVDRSPVCRSFGADCEWLAPDAACV